MCSDEVPKLDDTKGWISAMLKCSICNNEWIGVYHSSCEKLECHNCGLMVHFEIKELC